MSQIVDRFVTLCDELMELDDAHFAVAMHDIMSRLTQMNVARATAAATGADSGGSWLQSHHPHEGETTAAYRARAIAGGVSTSAREIARVVRKHGYRVSGGCWVADSTEEIYFIVTEPYDGLVKIGRTVDVTARLRALQTGNSAQLQVLHSTRVQKSERRERAMHAKFASRWKHGEWFQFDELELQQLIDGVLSE